MTNIHDIHADTHTAANVSCIPEIVQLLFLYIHIGELKLMTNIHDIHADTHTAANVGHEPDMVYLPPPRGSFVDHNFLKA